MSNVSRETNVVFVVEGKNDKAKLMQIFPKMQILTTNGSAISSPFLREVKELSKKSRVILMLDPDGPGEKIRKTIEKVAKCEHIFVKREVAVSKNRKKIGIEHMSEEEIRKSLETIVIPKHSNEVIKVDLFDLGLIGKPDSSVLREYVCSKLNIGKGNAKTFLNKINMFGISIDQIREIVGGYIDR